MKLFVLVLLASNAFAQEPLRVLCSEDVAEVVREIQPEIEKSERRKIALECGPSAELEQRIVRGDSFDVAILPRPTIDRLRKLLKIDPVIRREIATVEVALGSKAGGALPRINYAADFKATMSAAKSIAISNSDQTRSSLDCAFRQLGIESLMVGKIQWVQPGLAPQRVAGGQAEYALAPVTEILRGEGVTLVGVLPREFQVFTTFEAGAAYGNVPGIESIMHIPNLASLREKYHFYALEGQDALWARVC